MTIIAVLEGRIVALLAWPGDQRLRVRQAARVLGLFVFGEAEALEFDADLERDLQGDAIAAAE